MAKPNEIATPASIGT